MAILGRLAFDQTLQGRGLGAAALRDAVERTQAAGAILGIRGLLVHALSEEAKLFYEYHGFVASPSRPMTLEITQFRIFWADEFKAKKLDYDNYRFLGLKPKQGYAHFYSLYDGRVVPDTLARRVRDAGGEIEILPVMLHDWLVVHLPSEAIDHDPGMLSEADVHGDIS